MVALKDFKDGMNRNIQMSQQGFPGGGCVISHYAASFITGEKPQGEDEHGHAQPPKTEISLTLTNKFEIPEDDDTDMRASFVRLVLHSSLSPSSEGLVLSRLRASLSYNSRGQDRVKGTGQHYSGNFL